ncbi:MAG: YciI family protein [Clostridia bacterium]
MMFVRVRPGTLLAPEERQRMHADLDAWVSDVDRRGVRLQGSELLGGEAARAVRVRDGSVEVAPSPPEENRESITGFDILDCASLQEAIALASRHPVAKFGAIDLRPFAGS